MARITVEDCLNNIKNRFELVLIASKRARQISREGAALFVSNANDKVTVTALREIAANLVNEEILDENKSLKKIASRVEDIKRISDEIIAETQTLEYEVEQNANKEITEDSDNPEDEAM